MKTSPILNFAKKNFSMKKLLLILQYKNKKKREMIR